MTAHQPISGYLTPQDVQRAHHVGLRRGTINKIVAQVADLTCLPAKEIMGRSRKAPIAQARFLCWFVARQQGMTLHQIARAFGRDHTTILHGIQREEAARAALKAADMTDRIGRAAA